MKKIISALFAVLLIFQIVSIFANGSEIVKDGLSKYYDDCLIITVNKENTQNGRTFTVKDFSEIDAVSVKELTKNIYLPSQDGVVRIDPEANLTMIVEEYFRTILVVHIKNGGKENIQNALEKSKKLDFVQEAHLNYVVSVTDVKPNSTSCNEHSYSKMCKIRYFFDEKENAAKIEQISYCKRCGVQLNYEMVDFQSTVTKYIYMKLLLT